MRSPSKRSRSKSNRPKPLGNIVNRVFESSGPEGKVRGTPQQIIDKYLTLARDAQLSGDRVASENFLQHGEHYARMLNDAQREMAREAEARREQQGQNAQQSGQQGNRRGEAQQDGQNGAHHGAQGRQDQGAGSGRDAADDDTMAAGRATAADGDGQRAPQRDGSGEAQGDAVGERRAAGRNRRRDQKPGDQKQHEPKKADHKAAEGGTPSQSRNPARNRSDAAGFGADAALGEDGHAALVDTPEGRAARGGGRDDDVIAETATSDAVVADKGGADKGPSDKGPRFVTEAQPGADDGVAAASPASAEEPAKPRRKPAARKPRVSTAARRNTADKTQDNNATDTAPAEGSSNAAE